MLSESSIVAASSSSAAAAAAAATLHQQDYEHEASSALLPLCKSCDRCRSRKTKCDGELPCGACRQKYMKQTGLTSLEGVPFHLFGCVFSPAKKRGPNPGHKRKTDEHQVLLSTSSATGGCVHDHYTTATNGIESRTTSSAVVDPSRPHGPDGRATMLARPFDSRSMSTSDHDHSMLFLLLDLNHPLGNTLRSLYHLAINEILRLPKAQQQQGEDSTSGRLAELALGALVKQDMTLAMKLCNAVVYALQQELTQKEDHHNMDDGSYYYFDIAKTYFLLGVFRSFRGDFGRYFKYRRVCLTYLSKLPNNDRTFALLAAVSYQDALAYIAHNGNAEELSSLPISGNIPSLSFCDSVSTVVDEVERKYCIRKDVGMIIRNPDNRNWIQGPPPVFLNNEAPLHSRVLDALSCSFRSCCDTACGKYCTVNPSVTAAAVMCHENELCGRNMILSAFTLLQQQHTEKSDGLQLVIASMDAFFENGEENELTDGQVTTLLQVCNSVIQNPLVLFHPGPTYHMVTNAAVLLAHLLNGMTAVKTTSSSEKTDSTWNEAESLLYNEVYDTYSAIRRVLILHRRKLPAMIRCHELPRATVDLGETLLCNNRCCQGFVFQACSPCVAAERAQQAEERVYVAQARQAETRKSGEIPDSDDFLDFDLDDDALLDMISGLLEQ